MPMRIPSYRTAVAVSLVLLASCTSPLRTVIELTQADIQARVARDFPIEEQLFVAALRLEHPQILLDERSDRIGIELTVQVSLGRRAYPGRVGVDGSLRYEPERGEFFLRDPVVRRFDVPDLSPAYAGAVREVAAAALAAILPAIPLYRLDSTPERAAKLFIQSIDVRNGRVRVAMGLR